METLLVGKIRGSRILVCYRYGAENTCGLGIQAIHLQGARDQRIEAGDGGAAAKS